MRVYVCMYVCVWGEMCRGAALLYCCWTISYLKHVMVR